MCCPLAENRSQESTSIFGEYSNANAIIISRVKSNREQKMQLQEEAKADIGLLDSTNADIVRFKAEVKAGARTDGCFWQKIEIY